MEQRRSEWLCHEQYLNPPSKIMKTPLALATRDDRIRLRNQSYHQRGENSMPQGVFSYKYEEEKTSTGMTALAGLPVYLDLASVLGLGDHIRAHMQVRQSQGWTDEQIILSLVLLNLAGGDSGFSKRMKGSARCSAGWKAKGCPAGKGGQWGDDGERDVTVRFLPLPLCSGISEPFITPTKRRSARRAKPSSLHQISIWRD
jgi:hypothetical protein